MGQCNGGNYEDDYQDYGCPKHLDLIIKSCFECPYYTNVDFVTICRKLKRIINAGVEIPKDCPLENYHV